MSSEFKKKVKGFTLVEVMISLLLVSLAMLFLMKVTIHVFHLNRQSKLRFDMNQWIELKKNQLQSKAFDSPSLASGKYKESSGGYELIWEIRDLDPTLKKIKLSIRTEAHIRKTFFYKSKYIKEVHCE